ncbi:eotaxin-like [Hypanus sabinus]|uniref:eotaxin-like n=1 Tax=Hypanus sabinus TaxID=79690 RepID=UPI0028C474A6|nr:eotaxin-like [Hypanus sabinus]XP_059849411.1 eotaxin-like [Hypanus sabinus]
MKAALCVVAMLAALWICCFKQAAPAPASIITLECCERFRTTPIPRKRLKSYTEALLCPTPAVIFTNKRNMKICTRAKEEWVKESVEYLDRKHQGGKDEVKSPDFNEVSRASFERGFNSSRLPNGGETSASTREVDAGAQ